jgi:hypothetical protein
MPRRVLPTAIAVLLATGCGGTNTTPVAAGSDASDEQVRSDDATVLDLLDGAPEAEGFDAGAPVDSGMDADAEAMALWPPLDATCSPPPFDAGLEATVSLADAGIATVTTLPDGGYTDFFAIDDTTVYWTDYALASVWSGPLAGGPPALIADQGTPNPGAIAVDDTDVFWVSGTGERILRCPKVARNCTPYVVMAPFRVGDIALDATHVYTTIGGDVVACAKTGCRNAPTTLASGLGNPYDLIIHGDTLFMLVYPPYSGNGVQIGANVVTCPITGCGSNPTVLASDESPSGLATDGRYVYWVSQPQADQPASIKRCAVCGCGGAPEVLLPADAGVMTSAVVTDGVHVFFGDGQSFLVQDRLLACSVDGCGAAPTQLATGLPPYPNVTLGHGHLMVGGRTQIYSFR